MIGLLILLSLAVLIVVWDVLDDYIHYKWSVMYFNRSKKKCNNADSKCCCEVKKRPKPKTKMLL